MNRCRRVLLLPWDAEGDGSATGLTWTELPASCWEQGMCPAMLRTSVLRECPHPSLPSWGLMLFAFTHVVIVGCIPSILQGWGLQDTTAQPGSSGRGRTRCHHPWLPRVHRPSTERRCLVSPVSLQVVLGLSPAHPARHILPGQGGGFSSGMAEQPVGSRSRSEISNPHSCSCLAHKSKRLLGR